MGGDRLAAFCAFWKLFLEKQIRRQKDLKWAFLFLFFAPGGAHPV